jgi:hypothetical protein
MRSSSIKSLVAVSVFVSLTFAAPSADAAATRQPSAITGETRAAEARGTDRVFRSVQRLIQRLFGPAVNSLPTVPIPPQTQGQ